MGKKDRNKLRTVRQRKEGKKRDTRTVHDKVNQETRWNMYKNAWKKLEGKKVRRNEGEKHNRKKKDEWI